jgi:hypothetical protein
MYKRHNVSAINYTRSLHIRVNLAHQVDRKINDDHVDGVKLHI